MYAVILAGGQGTRLRPLTYARRKELVPMLGRPLLEHRLRNLAQHGIAGVVLACSQGMREVEEHFGDGAGLGLRVTYVYEERPLGSGRAVKEAARAAGATGTLVVCNGDIVTNIDLTSMIARHRETGATLSISLAPVGDPWQYGVVAVDDELRIGHFVEKPPPGEEPSNLINAGTWLFEPEVLERVPDDESAVRDGFAERVLFPGIIADGLRVQGFVEDLWVDAGSPERYLRANRLMLERAARVREEGRGKREEEKVILGESAYVDEGAEVRGLVWLGQGAQLAVGARVVGPTVIGRGAVVESRAVVEASVLWERARIGAGASVAGSIIGGSATVGAGASLRDAVLADRASVADGATPPAGVRVMPGAVWGEAGAEYVA